MENKRMIPILCVLPVVALLVGGGAAYIGNRTGLDTLPQEIAAQTTPAPAAAPTAEQSAAPEEEAGALRESVNQDTKIVLEKKFIQCGHTVEKTISQQSYVGMTENELAKAASPAKVESFSAQKVILSQESEGYCPDHAKLQWKDNAVEILCPNDAGELVLKKKLELSLELMPKEVREELEQGILFGSLDEVEQWLEDIAS
ncbi:Uncharacterised protein [uncultured Clostridium sp.]|nr:Uncharacterised protein [uncultured Clostridium sp.]